MKPITSTTELKAAIAELERRTKSSEVTLKGQFSQTKQALKPQNVLKNSFSAIGQTPEVRQVLVSTLIGFGIGYFTKKAQEVLTEENMNRFMAGLIDRGANQLKQKYPHALVSKGIDLTRDIARQKGLTFF